MLDVTRHCFVIGSIRDCVKAVESAAGTCAIATPEMLRRQLLGDHNFYRAWVELFDIICKPGQPLLIDISPFDIPDSFEVNTCQMAYQDYMEQDQVRVFVRFREKSQFGRFVKYNINQKFSYNTYIIGEAQK